MKPQPALQADWSPFPPLIAFLSCILIIRIGIPYLDPGMKSWSMGISTLGGLAAGVLAQRSTSSSIFQRLFQKPENLKGWVPGVVAGILVATAPLLIDFLISHTVLTESPLFSGAEGRIQDARPIGGLFLAQRFLIEPLLGQGVVLGLILAPWQSKIRQGHFLGMAGLLFMIVLWDFSTASLLTGVISAFFLQLTGSLFSGFVFQAGCGLGGILMIHEFPRSITLLGFLLQGII